MDLIVTPAVLIPRPETEHVVEAVLQTVGVRPQASDHKPRASEEFMEVPAVRGLRSDARIVDVATGSGCVALALAKELPHAEIHATDNSSAALEVARANAARHQLEDRIQFHETDLLAGLKPPFDLVVSNPPYVGDCEEDQVQLEVRKFEPRSAVFAGPTGTEVIARLIPQAHSILRPGGWLIMEVSGTIVDRLRNLLEGWDNVEVATDLQAIPRVVKARKR